MNYDLYYFKESIAELLKADTISREITCSQSLIKKYEVLLSTALDSQILEKKEATKTGGGIALSPSDALACMKDPIRTVRFIKGVYFGIKDLHKKYQHITLNILYAGCGPVAPLILPLLHLFSKEEISITLVDIHPESMEIAKSLIRKLNASDYFADYVIADATVYSFPTEIPLHCLISETMDKALTIEPQVEILKNLSHQIEPDGIQIPERIELQMTYSFFSKRPFFKTDHPKVEEPYTSYTKEIFPHFHIDKRNSNSLNIPYSSIAYNKPEEIINAPDICILTRVVIYDAIVLEDAQSLITNPYCVTNFYTFKEDVFKLEYTIDPHPIWSIKKVN